MDETSHGVSHSCGAAWPHSTHHDHSMDVDVECTLAAQVVQVAQERYRGCGLPALNICLDTAVTVLNQPLEPFSPMSPRVRDTAAPVEAALARLLGWSPFTSAQKAQIEEEWDELESRQWKDEEWQLEFDML